MKFITKVCPAILTATVALGMLCSGCRQEPAAVPPGEARHQASPEESFEEIADVFAKSVQTGAGGMPGGFVAQEEDGHSRLVIRNEVTHHLFPPKKEGDNYRGTITVTSQYDYSIQKTVEEGDSENAAKQQEEPQRKSWEENDGVNVIDNDLVKAPSNSTSNGARPNNGPAEDLIARRSDEDVRTYKLEYEKNRWVLKTKLDPETEQSIANAFDHVLSSQP
jgi:hypothetical protein